MPETRRSPLWDGAALHVALSALDVGSSRAALKNGGRELNPLQRTTGRQLATQIGSASVLVGLEALATRGLHRDSKKAKKRRKLVRGIGGALKGAAILINLRNAVK